MKFIKATYLTNDGFLIESNKHKILLDSIYNHDHGLFSAMREDIFNRIMARDGEFSDVDIVLCTHGHDDHSDIDSIIESSTADRINVMPAEMMEEKIPKLGSFHLLKLKTIETIDLKDLTITAIPTLHDAEGGKTIEYPHFSYFLEFKEEKINCLLMGDASTQNYDIISGIIGDKPIGLLIINFIEIKQLSGRKFINNINPNVVLYGHLPLPEKDIYKVGKLTQKNYRKVQNQLPFGLVCDEPETICTIINQNEV